MADRNRAAADVHLLGIELRPASQAGERLGGERLVELDHIHVAPADPGPRQGDVRRLHRPDPEHVRIDAVHPARDHARQRLAVEPARSLLVAEQHHGRTVVERRGVPGGHRPAGDERGLEFGQLLHRAIGRMPSSRSSSTPGPSCAGSRCRTHRASTRSEGPSRTRARPSSTPPASRSPAAAAVPGAAGRS